MGRLRGETFVMAGGLVMCGWVLRDGPRDGWTIAMGLLVSAAIWTRIDACLLRAWDRNPTAKDTDHGR